MKAASSGDTLVGGDARSEFTFITLVEVAGKYNRTELHAEVADEQQERDANRPPLDTLVVDVNICDCEIGARWVGRSAELAGNHHSLDGPRRIPERERDLDRRTRGVARESILVEQHGAMVLGDHVEVLGQGTVGHEARPLLYADHMPRDIRGAWPACSGPTFLQGQDSKRGSEACLSDVDSADPGGGRVPASK